MAFYDWNHDDKNDITDDYLEYQIYKNSTNNSKYTSHTGGISTFGAIVASVGGLFLAALIIALLGGGEDTPVVIAIILWIVCGAGLGVWFDSIGF